MGLRQSVFYIITKDSLKRSLKDGWDLYVLPLRIVYSLVRTGRLPDISKYKSKFK